MSTSRITKRVGVFGGTFDPIHNGHVAVARAVLDALKLDLVLFVVTSDQWLRESPPQAASSDRFNMVELAVDNVSEFEASDVDIVRDGSTYTVDTLRDLGSKHGDSTELFLIVGADSASSMDRWKDAEIIGQLATIVAVGRPGQALTLSDLPGSHPAAGAEYVEGPMIDISATRVRERLATGDPIDDLVSDSVVEYIEAHDLYR